jgi:FkbH-like protein
MKEIVLGDPAPARLALPPEALAAFAGFAKSVEARTQIVWGEHCSECAFPGCYAVCAFYEPKPGDLHCRRFEAGLQGVRAPEALELKHIRFRRWGKLEGTGPAALRGAGSARGMDRADAAVSRLLEVLPAPFAVKRNLAWRWNGMKARASGPPPAQGRFVVESLSPTGKAHGFTLTFLEDSGARRMHQSHFQASGAYGRHSVPTLEIAAAIDLAQPWRVQIEPVGEAAGIEVVFGLTDFVVDTAAEAPKAAPAKARSKGPPLAKVLVWDLDETLWTGTLAEDGPGGVTPRPEAVLAVRALDERGVLQSIASKNDPAEVQMALKRFGLDPYFLHPEVGWGPKSQSVARIAAAFDLGLDTFVFIDDQPFERAEVQASHPKVRALAHTDVAGLLTHAWFQHPVTTEGRGRRASYQAEARRTEAFETGGGDYLEFLKGSGLALHVAPLGAAEAPRVHELSQRTNQLNFTGAKLARSEVVAMAKAEKSRARWTLRCLDRFGDYGLIGFVELDLQAGMLLEFFMSCRVQRKRVEHAVFAHMAEALRKRGHGEMRVRFRATERNGAAVRMLTELEFARGEDDEDGWTLWRRSLAEPFADSDIVRLNPPASKAA